MNPAPAIRTSALRKVYPAPKLRRAAYSSAFPMPGGAPLTGAMPGAGPNGDIVALEGLDLEVRSGEFFGLLGPNGAGKTTTISILTTRGELTSGRAVVAGADVVRESAAVRQRIGVVPQRPNPDRSLTARENLIFHAAYFGIPHAAAASRADSLLAAFGLADRGGAKVGELSGGQQQRLMIARALMHDPDVLFLDEPTLEGPGRGAGAPVRRAGEPAGVRIGRDARRTDSCAAPHGLARGDVRAGGHLRALLVLRIPGLRAARDELTAPAELGHGSNVGAEASRSRGARQSCDAPQAAAAQLAPRIPGAPIPLFSFWLFRGTAA